MKKQYYPHQTEFIDDNSSHEWMPTWDDPHPTPTNPEDETWQDPFYPKGGDGDVTDDYPEKDVAYFGQQVE